MRAPLVALLLLAACGSKSKPDDCALVRDKPATAMEELAKRYPNDAVKVAQTIENCVAPSGDECDRIAKIVAAIPGMAPQIQMPRQEFDPVKTCREAPPEFRRCLLPSYTLAHAEECRAAMTAPITSVEVTPKSPAPADACGFVAIYVSEAGTWLATGREPAARCFAPRQGGALDRDWLEAQLVRAKRQPCNPSSAELAGAATVAYKDLVAAMDVAVKTGFMDVGLSSVGDLAVPLATADPKGAAKECPASLIPVEASAVAETKPRPPATSGTDRLKNALVVIVTKRELTLKIGDVAKEIATIADAENTGQLDALTAALPRTTDGMIILQADESTSAKVINLVIAAAKAAGYDNVLFAVKNR